EAGDRPLGQRRAHALLDARDELVRDRAAAHLVDELEAGAARQRLDAQEDLAELAGAAGLLLVAVVALGAAGDRLAVRDLRLLGVDLDAEAALELLHRDLEVQLAEPGDQRLVRARIVAVRE